MTFRKINHIFSMIIKKIASKIQSLLTKDVVQVHIWRKEKALAVSLENYLLSNHCDNDDGSSSN